MIPQAIGELRDALHNSALSSPGCEVKTLTAGVERAIRLLERSQRDESVSAQPGGGAVEGQPGT